MTHVGAFDMTGNVREWTSSVIGDERIILGGSWNDPYYIAGTSDASAPPDDRSPVNGFRLAVTSDGAILLEALTKSADAVVVRSPLTNDDTLLPRRKA